MKKRLVMFVSFMMLMGVLSGCSNKIPTQNDLGESQQSESSLSVIDELGRTVEIPENPEKVLGLTSAVMEALFNVGITPAGKVEEYKIREEGIGLPSLGMTKNLNIEKIYEIEPDLIIASSRFHGAAQNELELAGCPVYFFDPDKVGEISIVDLTPFIGELLGKPDAGNQYKTDIIELADKLKKEITDIGGYETGMIIKTGDSITGAQRSSGYGALLMLLGIDNIIPDDLPNSSKSPYVSYDVEQIIKDDPDVLFVLAPGKDSEANKVILADIKSDEKWSQLKAIQNHNVFMLPFPVNPNRMNVEDMLTATSNLITEKQ